MATLRIRPRFERTTSASTSTVVAGLNRALADDAATCRGTFVQEGFELMTAADHHFWSPELRFRVEEDGDGSRLVGHFGPKPPVWVMFMIIYIHLAFVGIAGLMYGTSVWIVGGSPWPLWGVPIALVASIVVYVAARIGQRLGADEVEVLSAFVDQSLEP